MAAPNGWRGYVSSREIGGSFVPQRVQNLVIRTYAERRSLVYLLSATEYSMNGCHMILQGIMAELPTLAGIIFYSTHQLPSEAAARKRLYEAVLGQSRSLHFALEELQIATPDDVRQIEDVMLCREISRAVDQSAYGRFFDIPIA